jgi:hypothetical protein
MSSDDDEPIAKHLTKSKTDKDITNSPVNKNLNEVFREVGDVDNGVSDLPSPLSVVRMLNGKFTSYSFTLLVRLLFRFGLIVGV